jgi:hypothetical protein
MWIFFNKKAHKERRLYLSDELSRTIIRNGRYFRKTMKKEEIKKILYSFD